MSILDLLDHQHFQFDAAVTCTFPDAFATFTLLVLDAASNNVVLYNGYKKHRFTL